MACHLTLVLPNLKLTRLEDFFLKNALLLEHEFKDPCFQLIIVTSALEGGEALAAWRKKYPAVKWIPISKNHGFSSTVNLGFTMGNGEWLGTVNDDVILSKGWWQTCIKAADEKTGSINPVIYDTKGKIESAGVKVLIRGKAEPIKLIGKGSRAVVDATNAAAVLYRRDALKQVGFFDECFGSYLEDIDLSLRLRRAGFENIVCHTARVTHLGHASGLNNRYKAWLDLKNWWLIIFKNWTAKEILTNLPAILLERLRNLSGLIKAL